MSLQGDLDDRAGTVEPPVTAARTKHSVGELFPHGAFTRLWLSRLFGTASYPMLLVVSLAAGAARAFQMPTQQALTPMVLPPALLPRGLAFSSAGSHGAIGPLHRQARPAHALKGH